MYRCVNKKTQQTCRCLFDDRYVVYIVFVDPDIDSIHVVSFGLSVFLERMTNHLKIPFILPLQKKDDIKAKYEKQQYI